MPKKNTLADLNDHLFMQIEKLNDDELTGEALEAEIDRAEAMTNIGSQITNGMKLQLEAAKIIASHGDKFRHDLTGLTKSEDTAPRLSENTRPKAD
ncbi:hypothetical protein DES40_1758 [Litorimonas taeanensis]|uniref:Phage protein n=1 Tax=Litorimonas taeanensis TaxID=568099 RepID=A0A420WDL6_9PROT|nr:hypothetical protein [Litorimonas taeanensis]RKQ68982.1 hypothetical protein DES40_1758 [Litorimonas taeanensis]